MTVASSRVGRLPVGGNVAGAQAATVARRGQASTSASRMSSGETFVGEPFGGPGGTLEERDRSAGVDRGGDAASSSRRTVSWTERAPP